MTVRVRREDSSNVSLPVPKATAEAIGITEGSTVNISVSEGRLIVEPAQGGGVSPEFESMVERIVQRYRPALRSLSRR